jgi:hypothetical protein
MINEWTYFNLLAAVKHRGDDQVRRLIDLLDCVPCILHMENRVGLKILTMLLNKGIQNAGNGDTYMNENNQKKRLANYITDVENIANRNMYWAQKTILRIGEFLFIQNSVQKARKK